jgi:hypothetical protein
VKLARRAGNLALFSRHQACVGLSAAVAIAAELAAQSGPDTMVEAGPAYYYN